MITNRFLSWVGFVLITLCEYVNAATSLTLSIHPFKPPTQLVESFKPLVTYLGEKLGGISVSLRIATDYQAHIDAIGRDEVDMAYMGPAAYVKLTEIYSNKPILARQVINGSPFTHAMIVAPKNSAINSLAEIKGKRFAFTERLSAMGYLVPRLMLLHEGVTIESLSGFKYVGDHVNVALAVLAGEFDAGAVKEDIYLDYEARGLRAIATSPALSDHLFVVSNTVPPAKVQQLRDILFHLHEDPNGKMIMSSIAKNTTAFAPAVDADYDPLRTLLKELKALGVAD